jgi:ATP-dependent Clp protease protease subunit
MAGTNHVWIYGIIGEKPKGASEKYYSFQNFLSELDSNATDITVHIYSPGGDVFEGQAIYNGLKNTGKKIKVLIEGVCASIATLIAGAADPGQLFINNNSQFMVHPPKFSNISGDSDQLRTGAEQLDQIKTLLIGVYQKRTGLPEEKLREIVDTETWMLPDVAKELGFVDEVVESMKAVAFADFKNINMEDKKTFLEAVEKLGDRITNSIANIFKPKNVTDTLADGTVIQVMSEDGDWVGKKVTYADGGDLPPGEHALAGGRLLVVGENSMITEVKETTVEDMKLKEEMEALKAQLSASEAKNAELASALEARNVVAVEAEAKAAKMENHVKTEIKAMQEELAKIKNTTVGDTTPPDLGIKKGLDQGGSVGTDPMYAFVKKSILEKRNTD